MCKIPGGKSLELKNIDADALSVTLMKFLFPIFEYDF